MKYILLLLVLASAAYAQTSPLVGGPMIQGEDLSPVSVTQPPPPAAPFSVPGVTVKLEEAAGFNRDAALSEAARQAMPAALAQLATPLSTEEATKLAASIGDPMQFVQSYKIIKEVLVPSYTLTVDLVFNGNKLQTNFGRRMVVDTNVSATTGEMTDDSSAGAFATVAEGMERALHVQAGTAAAQDAIFAKLAKAGFNPQWQVITRNGGTLTVRTTLDDETLASRLTSEGLTVEETGDGLAISQE